MATKIYRKGEVIFEEGDTLEKFYIVQSGSVQLGLRKDRKFVDFFAVGPNGFLGEYGLLGHPQHMFTAVARAETQVLEVPKQALKDEINGVPSFVKLLIKSSLERLKLSNQTLRHVKSPDQLSLFPSDRVPLFFAAAYYTIKEKAVEGKTPAHLPNPRIFWTMDFRILRSQMQRVFGLSVADVANFCHFLWRLKIIEAEVPIQKLKDWNPVEQVKIYHLESLRFFFDFYQYYFFKSGREDVLKLEPTLIVLIEEIQALRQAKEKVLLPELEKAFQKKARMPLNPEHFARLEKKGVFVQREQRGGETVIEGDWKELQNILWSWHFLQFLDSANEHGTVEFEIAETQAVNENVCPTCSAATQPQQKFCAECGAALGKAA